MVGVESRAVVSVWLSVFVLLPAAGWSDGPPRLGEEFQVNSYTTLAQGRPALAVQSGGDFVVMWTSIGSSGTDTSDGSVQGQRFEIPFFSDGFESGDTSAW